MLQNKRLWTIALAAAGAFVLYLLLGFLAVPALLKQQLTSHVDEKLKHKLTLGEVRFNPLTFALEVNDLDLKEASGGALVSCKRLFVNFQASSVFTRAWRFAEVTLESPHLNAELRKDGTHNFSALLAALHDPTPKPDEPPPPLTIGAIKLTDGRIDIADLQAGADARLRLAPIALELTDLGTLPGEKGPYKLTGRTADGESLTWDGDISLNPIASSAKLTLANWKLATFDRLLGDRLAIERAAGRLDATLEYAVAFTGGKTSASVKDFDLRLAQVAITPKGYSTALFAAETLALGDVQFNLTERTVTAKKLELGKSNIALEIDADGGSNWSALVPAAPASVVPSPQTDVGTPPSTPGSTTAPQPNATATSPPESPWRTKLDALVVAELGVQFNDRRAATPTEASVAGVQVNLGASAEIGAAGSTVTVDGLKALAPGFSFKQGPRHIAADALELSAGPVKSSLKSESTELAIENLKLALNALSARQEKDDYKLQTVVASGQSITAALATGSSASQQVGMEGVAIEANGMSARLADSKSETLQFGHATIQTKAVSLNVGGPALEANADALTAIVTKIALRDPAGGIELARIERAEATGGSVNMRDRRASIERLTLLNGHSNVVIGKDGTLIWGPLLKALAGSASPASKPAAKPDPTAQWKAMVKTVELRNYGGVFTDERQTPATTIALQDLDLRARDVGSERITAARIALSGRVKEGGKLAASGSVNLQTLETDVKLKVTELSLLPWQPVLAQLARLNMVSALASADGRLRYGQPKEAGADVVFEGELGLDKVAVEETEPTQPFLTLDAMKASDIKLTVGPNRLDIPQLRIGGLATRLLIAEDQSVNLAKLMRPRPEAPKPATTAAQTTAPAPAVAAATATAGENFPASIARISIDNSRLEFSDLSLRPQFATLMHELKGVINGVATAQDSRAQMELDARVDEFGSARIRGEMNLFNPRAFTDIDMVFRNLEMTALTPYSAKFAGYRIASGRLSMDLQYKIKDSALVGENKIVLDKLELGERVESPTAFNLPLELAIAILKDSDGKIDIGLPVSGSLNDPQFSYGQLIWKALGNLFARIVTAPFRALASLFGSGSDKLEAVDFDPGADRLLPPERQKLRTVAEALTKRPQLKLTVQPTYASAADRLALQATAIRRVVATRVGVKLQPGDEPGPLDFTNPRMQQAIEALYIERNSSAAARDIRAAIAKAAAATTEGGKPAPKPAPLIAAEVARAMAQQMIEAHPVSDADLGALAKRRGDAIVQELREAGKLDPARVTTAAPGAAESSSGKAVSSRLDLAVMK